MCVSSNMLSNVSKETQLETYQRKLTGTTHYYHKDGAVFQCSRVTEHYDELTEQTDIVVFRRQLGMRGIFGKEHVHPIYLDDVLRYDNNSENIVQRDAILRKFNLHDIRD